MKKYLFEIFLLIFSIGLPFALDTALPVYGMLSTFLIFLTLRRLSYWLFFAVFGFVLITSVLFLPQTLWFGHPPATMIGAFFETDLQESKEFVQSLPWYAYGTSIITFLFGIYILYLGKKKQYTPSVKYHLYTFIFALIGIGTALYKPIKTVCEGGNFSLVDSRTSIITFYASINANLQEYWQLKKELEQGIEGKPSWLIENVNPEYKDYVLVIGESVRRDYMHAYGFPLQNTPFMENVKGTVLEGFTATAPNTTPSLLRTFVVNKGTQMDYANNLITLANMAGFETYWLSNQGYVGQYDTPITKIASLSKYITFTKKGYSSSMNYHDTVLLPVLDKLLQEKSDKPRLFVLHLLGSHTLFEARLEAPIHFDYYNRKISAYVQTIEQTDKLLSGIYKTLRTNSQKFSMIYFADHGLMTQDRTSAFASLTHGDTHPNKACYRVPFVLINSNDTEHKHLKVNKSAFNFLKGYAHWLGIKEQSLNNNYSFLSPPPDSLQVFNHYENVPFESLEEDDILKP